MNTNTKWRYGCDTEMTVSIPRGYSYVERTVRCGSTAYDGGVNQCGKCNARMPPPVPEYGDIEHLDDGE